MSEIRTAIVSVTTTGAAGSASGTADSEPINGRIEHIFLDFHASAPATTDVTIAYKNKGGNILATVNTVTDAMFTPRAKCVDNANAAITDSHTRFSLADSVSVTLAQSDALTAAVTAYIIYERT